MRLYPDAALRFVNESGRIRTPSSRETSIQHLRHLQSLNPTVDLEGFTYDMLAAYCLRPKANGTGPSSPSAIIGRRTQLCSFFGWAFFVGLIPSDPSAKLKYGVKAPRTFVRSHTWLTEEQMGKVLNMSANTVRGRRDRIVLLVAALTGMRAFELAALRWSMFSPELDRLTLTGKGQKLATIGVPPQLVAELRAWRQVCQDPEVLIPSVKFVNGYQEPGQTLVVHWHIPLGTAGIRVIVADAGKRAGVPFLRPHDLRRSFAGWMEAKGVPLKDISMAMRHSNIATTDRYLERNPARAVEVTAGFTINLGVSA